MSNSIRSSLGWSFLSRYLTIAVQFVSVMVLARLLTPEEIGVYSIVVALFALGQMLRDFGIGEYIAQERDLTRDKIASAFTISLAACYSMALLFYLLGPAIAAFYGRPELEVLTNLLVFNFMMVPFGTLTLSLLRRKMQFKQLMLIDLGSSLAYTGVAISAAYLGYSYLSLAWASLSGTAATILLAMLFRPADQPWLPGLSRVTEVGSFGWKLSYAQLLNHLNNSAPELIIGKFLGAHAVAIFSKALSTVQLFTVLVYNALAKVIVPVLAEKHHNNEDLKTPFLFGVAALTAVAWPFFTFFALLAEPIVLLLYGDQWIESIPLLRVVCIAAILFYSVNLVERLLVSKGRSSRMAVIHSQFLLVAVVGIVIGAQFDLFAVALAVIGERLYRVLVLWGDMRRELDVRFADCWPIILKSAGVTLLAALPMLLGCGWIDTLNPLVLLIVTGMSSMLFWLAGVFAFDHPVKPEVKLLSQTVYTILLQRMARE